MDRRERLRGTDVTRGADDTWRHIFIFTYIVYISLPIIGRQVY